MTSPSTQINAARFLQHVININKSLCVHKFTDKYIEHQNNYNKHERKTCMTTRIYKRWQKTSPKAENENHPFRERLLD